MSRGFFGGGGGANKSGNGRDKNKLAKLVSARDNATREQLIDGIKNTHHKDHREMLDDLIDERMFSPKKKTGFSLPGTQPTEDREISKGMKYAMEMMQQKRMKKRKGKEKVVIKPKSYGSGPHGGRLDSTGKIMNNAGQILLRIDPETGVITDGFGIKVGKYNPNSAVCDTKIEQLIARYSMQKSKFNPFAPKE